MFEELSLLDVEDAALAEIDTLFHTLLHKATLAADALSKRDRLLDGRLGDQQETFCRAALSELLKHPDLIPPDAEPAALLQSFAVASSLRKSFQQLDELKKKLESIEEALGGDFLLAGLEAQAILDRAERPHALPVPHRRGAWRRSPQDVVRPMPEPDSKLKH